MIKLVLNHPSATDKPEILLLRQAIQLISLALLAVFVAACAMPAAPLAAPAPPAATPTPEEFRSWVKGEFTSPALAGNLVGDSATKPYLVYLPPSYPEGNKRYPAIYALHGWSPTTDEYQLGGIALQLDRMIARGNAPEMIVVFPNASNAFGGTWYGGSPTVGDYETYITRDLVNHIDATFRTIPQRDSRGITGCTVGGSGAVNLAFDHLDVFSVAVGLDGIYDFESDPLWEAARNRFKGTPSDFTELDKLPWQIKMRLSIAAEAAPNPDKPPFYLDMPFEMVDGQAQIVPEVAEKINAAYSASRLQAYLDQPLRLRGIMLYHGGDSVVPREHARAFDELLNQHGVEHEYLEVNTSHCDFPYEPLIQFMAQNLSFEMMK